MADEKQYYEPLRKQIESGDLRSIVVGEERLHRVLDITTGAGSVPTPSIDSYTRQRCASVALEALNAMHDLHVIGDFKHSISQQPGETMYPDFLLYNEKQHVLLIVEVKDSADAARHTLTETYAYDHEVRTRLPFLSSASIVHIVVSTVWTTLLQHAISGAIAWQNKVILCLTPSLERGNLSLAIELPAQWEQFFGALPPANILTTIPIALIHNGTPSNISERLHNALSICAREGARLGSHGFVLSTTFVKDVGGIVGFADIIWVTLLNSFAFLRTDDSSSFSAALRAAMAAHPPDEDPSVEKLTRRLRFVLSNEFEVRVGKITQTWAEARWNTLPARYIPEDCYTWGLFEDLVLETYASAGARVLRSTDDTDFKWTVRSPEIVLPIIDEFIGNRPFGGFPLTAPGAYNFGLHLGIIRDCAALGDALPPLLLPFARWFRLTLIPEIRELNHLLRARLDDRGALAPDLTLPTSASELTSYCKHVASWCSANLLDRDPILLNCLLLGYLIGATSRLGLTVTADLFASRADAVINQIRSLYRQAEDLGVSAITRERFIENAFPPASGSFESLDSALGSDSLTQEYTIRLADFLATALADHVEALHLSLRSTSPALLDVDGYRENLRRINRDGLVHGTVGLIRTPNGEIMIGDIPNVSPTAVDIDVEVYSLDQSHGPSTPKLLSWEDLRRNGWPP